MDVVGGLVTQVQTYLLVLARMGGMFGFAPIFGSYSVPLPVKAGICAVLAFLVFPLVAPPVGGYPADIVAYGVFVGREVLVGAIIGYAGALFLVAAQLAGQLADMQIGFGFVNVVDPMSSRQVTVMGQVHYLLAVLLFLLFNGHHLLIKGIFDSYGLVPISSFALTPRLEAGLVRLFCDTAVVALRIAAPAVCTLFLADVVMALLSRAVPQINVFIAGFPVKVAVGLATLAVAMPAFAMLVRASVSGLDREILSLFGGGR